ncbi:MAG TPA: hypothetical protein VF499_12865, partial [Afipia sp.]
EARLFCDDLAAEDFVGALSAHAATEQVDVYEEYEAQAEYSEYHDDAAVEDDAVADEYAADEYLPLDYASPQYASREYTPLDYAPADRYAGRVETYDDDRYAYEDRRIAA